MSHIVKTPEQPEPLIFERSVPGRRGFQVPNPHVPADALARWVPADQQRADLPPLPEVSELDVVRHFTRLSQLNFSVDTNFYPLGSCTMKYNPKINDRIAAWSRFAAMHPMQPESASQGLLRLLHELEDLLCRITGMAAFTLQPAAGAQGELTGLKIIRAYHRRRRQARSTVLIPDSAHGTNPASAVLSGFQTVELKSSNGRIDLNELKNKLSGNVAALMLTNPNTLGLFEKDIRAITSLCHEHGALVYMDGANMNALLGIVRPGDMGIDLLQLNLHKTFSTPHGGGGPGAGPVGVTEALADFLPTPRVRKTGARYTWDERASKYSVGRVHGFYGNVGVLVRAYVYIRTLGKEGLERASRLAILNANYVRARVADTFPVPFGTYCLHEFVASLKPLKATGVTAWDAAKRLLDYGFYAPTVYFPMLVEEAFMVEPTETESKETLDLFVEALLRIAEEAKLTPERVKLAPTKLSVDRLDEVKAAREPNLRWTPASKVSKSDFQFDLKSDFMPRR